MIAYIDGKIAYKDPTFVVIDVNGVGYLIKISLQTYAQIKSEEKCRLQTYLHIKEDAHTLYGFADGSEKKIFTDLISVSGIGPNTALLMLSSLSSGEIEQAIATEDVRTIQSVKGIGAKTAQLVVLQLKDKIRKTATVPEIPNFSGSGSNNNRQEALQALIMLGLPKNVAEKNIDLVIKKEGNQLTLEQLIKSALKAG
ncbi:MAG: Holliday junction branch migration protein RuvA [Verrucomicrobia bacterium]|nr:Holliday junction branch migration protein RuvA [Cytophagales bacterium]